MFVSLNELSSHCRVATVIMLDFRGCDFSTDLTPQAPAGRGSLSKAKRILEFYGHPLFIYSPGWVTIIVMTGAHYQLQFVF